MNQPERAGHGSSSAQRGMIVVLSVWTVLLLLCSAGAAVVIARRYRDVRKGWNLVPVVVAAVDLHPGTPITMDVISQRSMPEQFVTESVVKPDDAIRVVNHVVRAKLLAGDQVLWRDLLPPGAPAAPGDAAAGGADAPASP